MKVKEFISILSTIDPELDVFSIGCNQYLEEGVWWKVVGKEELFEGDQDVVGERNKILVINP